MRLGEAQGKQASGEIAAKRRVRRTQHFDGIEPLGRYRT